MTADQCMRCRATDLMVTLASENSAWTNSRTALSLEQARQVVSVVLGLGWVVPRGAAGQLTRACEVCGPRIGVA